MPLALHLQVHNLFFQPAGCSCVVLQARDYTDDGQQIAQAAATEVMCAALCSGSTDNVTAVAMLLDWS